MSDPIADEQASIGAAVARNSEAAAKLLGEVRDMDRLNALCTLLTAAVAVIQVNYPPEHRLAILNGLLGPTILEWAAEADGVGVTRQ